MTPPGSALAGLVGSSAQVLYNRLRLGGGMSADEFSANASAADELLSTGVALRCDDGLIRAVDPVAALRRLVDTERRRLESGHDRMLNGLDQLVASLPSVGRRGPGEVAGVRLLTDQADVAAAADELHSSLRTRLRATETSLTRSTGMRAREGGAARAARRQIIIQADGVANGTGRRTAHELARTGEVRVRARMPVRMAHVDDSAALVTTDRPAQVALLIDSPPLLALLADWFDLLWLDPASLAVDGQAAGQLPDFTRRVLALMPFDDDQTIARKLRVSVSTVRRNIKSIYGLLGTNNRFAAGVAAAKHGWI